ncbi:MAG: hypothetical protein LBG42_05620 [Treponema sp.]|nr:hypothetical protein [Treponema sp.]
MKRYAGIIGMVSAVLAALGIIAYMKLEIYPVKESVNPSREVRSNELAALERWLNANDHPVRKIPQGSMYNLAAAPEQTVFMEVSAFDWDSSDVGAAAVWVRNGGNLIVSIDYFPGKDSILAAFLSGFGIGVEEYPFSPPENEASSEDGAALPEGGAPEISRTGEPDFDYGIRFIIYDSPDLKSDTIKADGGIRLVSVSAGRGRLTVLGKPRFMMNHLIAEEANARLAWGLFDAEDGGVLFIRGRLIIKSFFGKFAERGDFRPFCVSLILLVAAGFWMVIPGFGLVRDDGERVPRPIEERFRAEVRFLKKYGSLAVYLDPYIRELRRIIRPGDGAPAAGEIDRIEAALKSGKKMKYREIIRDLLILEKTMESL